MNDQCFWQGCKNEASVTYKENPLCNNHWNKLCDAQDKGDKHYQKTLNKLKVKTEPVSTPILKEKQLPTSPETLEKPIDNEPKNEYSYMNSELTAIQENIELTEDQYSDECEIAYIDEPLVQNNKKMRKRREI